jgi:hypothetical protein
MLVGVTPGVVFELPVEDVDGGLLVVLELFPELPPHAARTTASAAPAATIETNRRRITDRPCPTITAPPQSRNGTGH